MPTRNVVLSDEQERLIRELVEGGQYQNASEVLREGLRLIERREREEAARIEGLRHAVAEGEDAIARGAYASYRPGLIGEIAARVRKA